ncbi:MAG: hypothetical protein V1855_02355 [bacterium]
MDIPFYEEEFGFEEPFTLEEKPTPPKPLNIVLTPYNQKSQVDIYDTTMYATAIALRSQVAPIITRKCIINKILKHIDDYNQKGYFEIGKKFLSSLNNLNLEFATQCMILRLCSDLLKPNKWLIYDHDDSDSYLLIPQHLFDEYENFFDFTNLKSTNIETIKKSTSFSDPAGLDCYQRAYHDFLGEYVKDIKFAQDKVFMAKLIKKMEKQLAPFKNSIPFKNYVLSRLKNEDFALWSPLKMNAIFSTNKSRPWNILLIAHGYLQSVAEYKMDDFRTFLKFLDTEITTNYFVYKSCYAGGIHALEVFGDNKFNFTTICGSLGNWPVIATLKEYIPSLLSTLKGSIKGVANLFKEGKPQPLLGVIDEATNKIMNIKLFFEHLNNDKIEDAMHSISPTKLANPLYKKITHIPRIRKAHETSFNILNIYPENIYITSDAPSQKVHNKSILILTNPNINYLEFAEKLPLIVSNSPHTSSNQISKILIKEGLIFKNKSWLNDFFLQCFFFHPLTHSDYKEWAFIQSFFIKNIIFSSSKNVTNPLIQCTDGQKVYLNKKSLLNIFIKLSSEKYMVFFSAFFQPPSTSDNPKPKETLLHFYGEMKKGNATNWEKGIQWHQVENYNDYKNKLSDEIKTTTEDLNNFKDLTQESTLPNSFLPSVKKYFRNIELSGEKQLKQPAKKHLKRRRQEEEEPRKRRRISHEEEENPRINRETSQEEDKPRYRRSYR